MKSVDDDVLLLLFDEMVEKLLVQVENVLNVGKENVHVRLCKHGASAQLFDHSRLQSRQIAHVVALKVRKLEKLSNKTNKKRREKSFLFFKKKIKQKQKQRKTMSFGK